MRARGEHLLSSLRAAGVGRTNGIVVTAPPLFRCWPCSRGDEAHEEMEDSAIESVSSKSCGGGVDVAVLRALLAAAAAARFALGDACCGRDSSGASGEPQPRCPSAKVMPLLAFGDADGRTSSSSSSSSTAEDGAAAGAVVTVCWSSR